MGADIEEGIYFAKIVIYCTLKTGVDANMLRIYVIFLPNIFI